MNITVRFEQWSGTNKFKQQEILYYWEKIFNRNYELALGYIYALKIVKPTTSIINISIDNNVYDPREFFNHPLMRQHFVSTHALPPKINEPLDRYLKRIKRTLTMQYMIVITPNPKNENNVHIIQFNQIELLQGFISILQAFDKSTIDYIVTIYGNDNREYTIRY